MKKQVVFIVALTLGLAVLFAMNYMSSSDEEKAEIYNNAMRFTQSVTGRIQSSSIQQTIQNNQSGQVYDPNTGTWTASGGGDFQGYIVPPGVTGDVSFFAQHEMDMGVYEDGSFPSSPQKPKPATFDRLLANNGKSLYDVGCGFVTAAQVVGHITNKKLSACDIVYAVYPECVIEIEPDGFYSFKDTKPDSWNFTINNMQQVASTYGFNATGILDVSAIDGHVFPDISDFETINPGDNMLYIVHVTLDSNALYSSAKQREHWFILDQSIDDSTYHITNPGGKAASDPYFHLEHRNLINHMWKITW